MPPDVPLADLGLDSLALVEWFYAVESSAGVEIDFEVIDRLGDTTPKELYKLLLASTAGS